jgi:glycosyltransferase involved in cell wall biosynthesis
MSTAPPAPRRVLWIWHAAVVAEYQKPLDALAAQGWDMHLLVPRRWPERGGQMTPLERRRGPPGVTIHPARTLFTGFYYIYLFPGLLGTLLRLRPDVLHVYEEAHSLLPALILLLRPWLERLWGRPVPVILYAAQNIVKTYPWPFRVCEAYCFRHADLILPCGEWVAATLRAKGYRGPLRVVPLPSDPTVFAPDEAARCRQRAELGLAPETVLIGYAGKLAEEKGVGALLEAFLRLPGTPHLVFAGGGPEARALAGRAAAAGVGERVHLPGGVAHEALVGYMNAADIWVVPSQTRPTWREQFGRVAVEAMACGLPVVVTASGELPRVAGAAGRVVPEGDNPALAAALADLAADPPARAALGRAARSRVLACYTPAVAAALYAASYAEVLRTEDEALSHER